MCARPGKGEGEMMMQWWHWLIAGVVMILLEFPIPGFVICFFGVSALLTGALLLLFPCIGLVWQILIFAFGGGALAVMSRWFFPSVFRGGSSRDEGDIDGDEVSGDYCVCEETIAPGLPGKVEFRGSLWSAEADERIEKGTVCVVLSRHNLMLKVRRSTAK